VYDPTDVDDILSKPLGHWELVDECGLDTKITHVEWAIGAERKALLWFARARVDEAVLGEKSLEAAEEGLELWGAVNVGLGDACESHAKVGELGTPDGLDIGAEFVDDLEGAGATIGVLVGPLEEDDGPFDDLVRPVEVGALDTGALDVECDEIVEWLFRARGQDGFWGWDWLVVYALRLGIRRGGAEEIGNDALHDAGAGKRRKVGPGLGEQGTITCAERGERAAGDQKRGGGEERQ
jgi:hypothetical protein